MVWTASPALSGDAVVVVCCKTGANNVVCKTTGDVDGTAASNTDGGVVVKEGTASDGSNISPGVVAVANGATANVGLGFGEYLGGCGFGDIDPCSC